MANRKNTFLIKRSNVAGKIPAAGDLLLGELAINTADAILYASGTTANSILPIGWDRVARTGDTMTGTLYAPSISATTISAESITVKNYIDIETGTTTPSNVSGRIYFDPQTNGLTYNSYVDPNVKVKIGRQLYARVNNFTGTLIPKGTAVAIQSATNGIPNASVITSSGRTNNQVVGLAADDIQNGSVGLVLTQGILSGVTTSYPIGSILYLSDTVPGATVASTTSLQYSSRSHQIGYVIATGTTNGEIYVSVNNEDTNLTITDIERNILEGNVISTGAYEFTGITVASTTTVNVAPMRGWIVNNTYSNATLPTVTNLYYTGGTGITITNINTADSTYLLVNSASTLFQQTTFPTPQQRRENIYLGKVIHPNKLTIQNVNNTVDFDVSPMSALRDLWTPLKLINQGVVVSPNGANLNINTSSGTLWGNGIGWVTNQLNPDSVTISATSPTTFQYRVQTGGTFSNTTTIDVANYDLNGVVTAVGGGSNASTNQRVYLFPTGLVRLQYGQHVYGTLAEAVAATQTESFIEYVNNRDNGILIGIISINKSASQLNNTAQARFTLVSKFGELLGGTGGLSTTTLQQAYDNSTTPEIITNSTLGALSIKNGTGNADNITNTFETVNAAGTTTSFIRADGYISGSTFKSNGFHANNGGATATTFNILTLGSGTPLTNLGIDVNGRVVSGTTGGSTFTGGTVTGPTNFTNGLTGNTISATTIKTASFTANNGGITATTVSATTYYNLPTDVYSTGGTYNGGNLYIINNTGGTFTVTGLTASGFSANYYGSFSDTTTQPVTGVSTPTVWTYNTTELSNGISVVNGSQIKVANKGVYEIGYSAQLEKTQGTSADATIWAAINGIPVARSSSITSFVSNSVIQLPFVSYIFELNANDYVEFYFSSPSQDIQLSTFSGLTTPTRPTAPSVIIVAKQVGLSVTDNLGGNYLPLSGGTVTGGTVFNNGLTANTISATTYYNLPNTTLQQAYTASTSPEFTINSTQLGIQFRNNTGDDNTPMIVVQNNAGIDKGEWRADGTIYTAGVYSPIISATTYYNLPIDVYTTGGTYNTGTGVATFTNNTGGTFNVSGFGEAVFTGGTVTGPTNFTDGLTANTISATTYYNLPTDVYVTGGTYNTGAVTFTNNTGGTFNVIGFYTGSTDVYVTGGTYSDITGTATLTNNTGGTFNISGFYTGSTDVYVTGGTYNDGTILFTNNTGGTFNVSGLYTGVTDVFVTGGTYSAGTAVFTNNTGGTFNVSGFSTSTATEFTGGTVTGSTIFTGGLNANSFTSTTISATTYYNLPIDVYTTGGTYDSGIISFTNNTGGTFNVSIPANYAAGVISGATGWTSTGTGQINLPAVKVALYNNPNNIEPIMVYDVASGTTGTGGLTGLTNNDTNYIVIEYNSGSPRYAVYDNDGVVDDSSVVLFMVVYRANNFIHTLEFGNQGAGLANKLNDRFIMTDRFGYESGLALGLSASTGIVTLSAGVAWNGPNRQSLNALNSSGSTFFKNYHSGGTWTYTTTASTINNTYYDDGTDIVTATGGKYLVNWYFRGQEINDHIYEVYGTSQYDSVALAQLSTEPSLPELITSHAILLGRIIILVGANTGLTESAFVTPFQATQVTAHNDLNSIQGGTAGQYYHLTSAQYNNLALTNTDNNFSVLQTFNSGLKSSSVSATTYLNLPTDIRVTGGTYSNSVATFTNNTGGTFTVTGLTTPFTGGTVTGATRFTGGLTANTISATTYANLPTDIRVTGSTYTNNTFTYTNNTGGTFNVLFNTVTGLTTNGNLTVTGNTSMIGTLSVTGNTNVRAMTGTSATISGTGQSILTVIGSGNSTTSPLFTVQGSSGELFSVTDSLTGSLFSVNDISGLPILEVFSDNTVLMGSYLAPSLNTTARVTLTAGTNTVYSIPTSAYTGAFFDYTVISTGTTGARAGTIMSIWSGTTAQYTDVSTNDIGTTSGISFSVAVVGSNAVLSSSATTAGWTLKTIIRSI
jgi:hypothetical protein